MNFVNKLIELIASCIVLFRSVQESVQESIAESVQNFTEERKPEEEKMLIERLEAVRKENEQLKQTIKEMEKDANIRGEQTAINILQSICIRTQIKRIMGQKRTNWSIEDITSAIALRSVSARAYNYLREVRKMPLPCTSTLRRWISEFELSLEFFTKF